MKNCTIHGAKGQSSYFRGLYQGYGMHQWCIKYYGFQSEFEIELALLWAFGDYSFKLGQFDLLNDIVGRPVKAYTDGRSGGWLVIDEELSEDEILKVTNHVKACLKGLDAFLKEERELNGVTYEN